MSCGKMASGGSQSGSSLASDLVQIQQYQFRIEYFMKRVEYLERLPVTKSTIAQIQNYKHHILQLKKRNKVLRDEIDRC